MDGLFEIFDFLPNIENRYPYYYYRKCDGTDPFVFEYDVLGGIQSKIGPISEREYANAYYRYD
jgi:hypothetical protein